MPGVRGPAPGEAIVVAYFASEADANEVAQSVAAEFSSARTEVQAIPAQDWSESWKSLIRSVEVGRLWVGPPWDQPKAGKQQVQVIIEPKMAFGTGDHPTTFLCLKAVDAYLEAHPGCSVLDVGTGTGVLAIAAKKLGAGRCVGVDNDPVSVQLALENAKENRTEGLELSELTLDKILGPFDLVLANILANTLVELAPQIARQVKGLLCLAGILSPQKEEVKSAYSAQGLRFAGEETVGEWVRLDFHAH
jgi:ribosomal protein L11 methyltransferase